MSNFVVTIVPADGLTLLTRKQLYTQLCGYWCPGVKAPGHQYPKCWLIIHWNGPSSIMNVLVYVGPYDKIKLHF